MNDAGRNMQADWNPYVTEGLVAMWDGIWNAGPGKHEVSPAQWVDLIGGSFVCGPDIMNGGIV